MPATTSRRSPGRSASRWASPLAVGAAYAAYRVDNPGEKLVFTGAAAVSGALALHGIKTAAFPTPVGSDGIGLGTAGTF